MLGWAGALRVCRSCSAAMACSQQLPMQLTPTHPTVCPLAGWLAEAEVAHDCALWLLNGLASEGKVAVRQAALLEARRLLGVIQEAEGRLSAWLPAGRLAPLSQRRQQLGGILREMQAEGLRPRGGRVLPACFPADIELRAGQACRCRGGGCGSDPTPAAPCTSSI